MQGNQPLKTILRTAKAALEVPSDPADPLGTSDTIVPYDDALFGGGTKSEFDTIIRVQHLGLGGSPDVFLVWKGYVAGVDPTPTTRIPAGDTREFTLAALAQPFHVVVAVGDASQPCKVDRFYRSARSGR